MKLRNLSATKKGAISGLIVAILAIIDSEYMLRIYTNEGTINFSSHPIFLSYPATVIRYYINLLPYNIWDWLLVTIHFSGSIMPVAYDIVTIIFYVLFGAAIGYAINFLKQQRKHNKAVK